MISYLNLLLSKSASGTEMEKYWKTELKVTQNTDHRKGIEIQTRKHKETQKDAERETQRQNAYKEKKNNNTSLQQNIQKTFASALSEEELKADFDLRKNVDLCLLLSKIQTYSGVRLAAKSSQVRDSAQQRPIFPFFGNFLSFLGTCECS